VRPPACSGWAPSAIQGTVVGGQDESPPCWNTPVQIHRCPPWYLMRQDSISCVDHVRVENVVVHRSDDCCSLHFEFGFPHHFHFTSPTPIPNSPDQMSQDCTLTDSKALTYNLLSCFQDTNSYVHCLCCYPCCYSCNNHNVVWKIVKYAWEAWSHGKLWWMLINLNFAWKMVKYAWEAWSHGKLWWRLIAILTCKSFVVLGYGGGRLIEPFSNWFPPKFPSG